MSPLSLFAAAAFTLVALLGFAACADASTEPQLTRVAMAEVREQKAAISQKNMADAIKLILAVLYERPAIEPVESPWMVSGRVMYSGNWHIITTAPASFDQSKQVFNGLHTAFGGTPHQLSLLSLSNCADVSVLSSPSETQKQPR